MTKRLCSGFIVAALLLAACSSGSANRSAATTSAPSLTTTTRHANPFGTQPASHVTVPNVVGKGQLNAAYAVLRARLRVIVASRGNETVTEQKPAAGSEVPAGTVVTLVIASRD